MGYNFTRNWLIEEICIFLGNVVFIFGLRSSLNWLMMSLFLGCCLYYRLINYAVRAFCVMFRAVQEWRKEERAGMIFERSLMSDTKMTLTLHPLGFLPFLLCYQVVCINTHERLYHYWYHTLPRISLLVSHTTQDITIGITHYPGYWEDFCTETQPLAHQYLLLWSCNIGKVKLD